MWGAAVGGRNLVALGVWTFLFFKRRSAAGPPSAEEIKKLELEEQGDKGGLSLKTSVVGVEAPNEAWNRWGGGN